MTERAALERGVGEEVAREARPEWGGSVCALAEGPRRLGEEPARCRRLRGTGAQFCDEGPSAVRWAGSGHLSVGPVPWGRILHPLLVRQWELGAVSGPVLGERGVIRGSSLPCGEGAALQEAVSGN